MFSKTHEGRTLRSHNHMFPAVDVSSKRDLVSGRKRYEGRWRRAANMLLWENQQQKLHISRIQLCIKDANAFCTATLSGFITLQHGGVNDSQNTCSFHRGSIQM
ncbi:unnamed protein product [Pleuronectes platessa]|uniref:Uncharacterized protein n=1 Tax=Pleuronectes platessa TaxID=8262 RepID=A0A9N7YUP7_PLEPL|nr:unnamed protein product [Pleuronectes platessa]